VNRTAAALVVALLVALLPAEAGGIQRWFCKRVAATIVGTEGDDVIIGTPGRDIIHGLGGADEIRSRGGNDVVCAGAGRDVVYAAPVGTTSSEDRARTT
jgi:Ca2+-binding RTX toxin-like protein